MSDGYLDLDTNHIRVVIVVISRPFTGGKVS